MFHGGLKKVARDIIPVEFELKNGQKVKLKISKINILQPTVGETVIPQPKILQIFPKECRMRNSTYKGKLQVMAKLKYHLIGVWEKFLLWYLIKNNVFSNVLMLKIPLLYV
jgi:DNA-directed RNA polymerase beta subunit